jgi:hypothetical protein
MVPTATGQDKTTKAIQKSKPLKTARPDAGF